MTPADRAELRRLAEAARDALAEPRGSIARALSNAGVSITFRDVVNPGTVLALLDALDAAEAREQRWIDAFGQYEDIPRCTAEHPDYGDQCVLRKGHVGPNHRTARTEGTL